MCAKKKKVQFQQDRKINTMPNKIKQINQINPKLQMQVATSFSFMQNLQQYVQKKKMFNSRGQKN